VNALECINRLVSSLDKMIIIDEVIPFLTDIQCCDADIIMAVLGTAANYESAPIQLAQCRFPGLAVSHTLTYKYIFQIEIHGSNFIKQHSESVMV